MESGSRSRCIDYLDESRSQLKQDLFVLSKLDFKRGGFFVEFGATNGVDLSNTYLLEKKFGWRGILAEPGKCWHRDLARNRSAKIEERLVWSRTDEVITFVETDIPEISTVSTYVDGDFHAKLRRKGRAYSVRSVSLFDLLKTFDAPHVIDYLSVDTEGTEFEILNSFNFSAYDIRIISCEHNFTEKRSAIYDLLSRNGYSRVLEDVSEFDDWYVKQNS